MPIYKKKNGEIKCFYVSPCRGRESVTVRFEVNKNEFRINIAHNIGTHGLKSMCDEIDEFLEEVSIHIDDVIAGKDKIDVEHYLIKRIARYL